MSDQCVVELITEPRICWLTHPNRLNARPSRDYAAYRVQRHPNSPEKWSLATCAYHLPRAIAALAHPLVTRSLDDVLAEVAEWARTTFPSSTNEAKWIHLRKEVRELRRDLSDGEEMADVVMIVSHLAAHQGIDLKAEIVRKLAINRHREWGAPDKNGVVEHVR